jgi:hypothetical protein
MQDSHVSTTRAMWSWIIFVRFCELCFVVFGVITVYGLVCMVTNVSEEPAAPIFVYVIAYGFDVAFVRTYIVRNISNNFLTLENVLNSNIWER